MFHCPRRFHEIALVVAALKAGESKDAGNQYPRIDEIHFSSERKRMTTVHGTPEGGIICVMKDAVEIVLERCDENHDSGVTRKISASTRAQVLGSAVREAFGIVLPSLSDVGILAGLTLIPLFTLDMLKRVGRRLR